jgi:hypothetical protein
MLEKVGAHKINETTCISQDSEVMGFIAQAAGCPYLDIVG